MVSSSRPWSGLPRPRGSAIMGVPAGSAEQEQAQAQSRPPSQQQHNGTEPSARAGRGERQQKRGLTDYLGAIPPARSCHSPSASSCCFFHLRAQLDCRFSRKTRCTSQGPANERVRLRWICRVLWSWKEKWETSGLTLSRNQATLTEAGKGGCSSLQLDAVAEIHGRHTRRARAVDAVS
jgi:hypothetical protein